VKQKVSENVFSLTNCGNRPATVLWEDSWDTATRFERSPGRNQIWYIL